MSPEAIGKRAASVAAVRSTTDAARGAITAALVDVRAIRAWADAHEAGLVNQLAEIDSFPEATIADANRCSLGAAAKTTDRSNTLASTPTLADALENGAITAGHIDSVTRRSKQLDDPSTRDEFFDRADALTAVAAAGTVDQFAKRLDLEVKRLQHDDGEERLARQRRNVRLSTWTDPDGMWNLRGRFDPATAVTLAARLDTAREALFATNTPEHCPNDPVEKQRFLAAHALSHLVGANSVAGEHPADDQRTPVSRSRRPEYIAVIDADASHRTGPAVEYSIPVELPRRVLAELTGYADITGVVVRNGVVLHAPGELNLGRSTRLANRPQRRALNALYRHCAIPGCSVNYDRCKLHHIIWWRHGGRTVLDNLLPVCAAHHSKIHNDNWIIELGPNRELTLTLPDGHTRITGPPNRRTAA